MLSFFDIACVCIIIFYIYLIPCFFVVNGLQVFEAKFSFGTIGSIHHPRTYIPM